METPTPIELLYTQTYINGRWANDEENTKNIKSILNSNDSTIRISFLSDIDIGYKQGNLIYFVKFAANTTISKNAIESRTGASEIRYAPSALIRSLN